MENSNSTSGQLDVENDPERLRAAAIRIKLFRLNALGLVWFRNTCPSVRLFTCQGLLRARLSEISVEDFRGSQSVDRSTFCDSAQIHVFVRAMGNGK